MCGITGFIGQGTREDLSRMVHSLKHRGPDDSGIFYDTGIGIGHTRLKILDLTPAGHQPMFNNSRSIGVVFNGEIYNFATLRNSLIAKGYCFQGTSDTEVILYLYQEYKEKCFEKLDGMFAIALYDFSQNSLVLARDRMGEKPLYWAHMHSSFMFGSELKALMAHASFTKEIDICSLNKYFQYQYVPTPHTIFKNVYKLEPATILTYKNSTVTKQSYWKVDFTTHAIPFETALTRLDETLNTSVNHMLVSDVPVGIFLSGGLDSSAISYYAQKNTPHPIKTFSIGFKENRFDESNFAREVASFLGTEHTEHIVTAHDCINIIPKITSILDEPMADSSIIPTTLLSALTREKVTVALGGDGGDELFAGYQTFQAENFMNLYRFMPIWFQNKVLKQTANTLPGFDDDFGALFFLKKFINGIETNNFHTHQNWIGAHQHNSRSQLFVSNVWNELQNINVFEDVDRYIAEININTLHENKLLYMYMRTFLMDQVLVKVDRASMFHSLEVRAPFLAKEVIELANSLPFSYKMNHFKTKYILKELMKQRLPPHIITRTKKGFRIPLAQWLQKELKPYCNEILSEDRTAAIGLFNHTYIENLKKEHFEGKRNNSRKIWSLLVFYLWHEQWVRT